MAIDDRADVVSGAASDKRTDGAHDARTDGALGAAAVELTAELVGIDSVNSGLVPGASGEAAIVAHLRNRLQSNGFTTHVVTAPTRDVRGRTKVSARQDLRRLRAGSRPHRR